MNDLDHDAAMAVTDVLSSIGHLGRLMAEPSMRRRLRGYGAKEDVEHMIMELQEILAILESQEARP